MQTTIRICNKMLSLTVILSSKNDDRDINTETTEISGQF